MGVNSKAYLWEVERVLQTWVWSETEPLKLMTEIDGRAGSILFAFIAILVSIALLWRTDRKKAAVGRR